MFLRNDYFFRMRLQKEVSIHIEYVFYRNVFGNFPSTESYYYPRGIRNHRRICHAIMSQMEVVIVNHKKLSFLYGITLDRTSMDTIVSILLDHNIDWWAETIYQKLVIKSRYQNYAGLEMIHDDLLSTARSIWHTFFDMIEKRIRRDGFYI